MEKQTDTIVAISTPIGTGGVAIVRLSGPKALLIAKKMCLSLENNKNTIPDFQPRMMYYVTVKATGFNDNGMVVYFKAPNSFTGEDVVEFQVHGGVTLADGIVKECIRHDARMAQNGEFSKRAFLNGKLSLDAAEGIIDVINAESETEISAGYKLLNGEFYDLIKQNQNILKDLLTDLNVSIDYPNEDVEYITISKVENKVKEILSGITKIHASYNQGKIIKHGIDVCLVGRPNAGKSNLINALTSEQCAIVSSTPGTTRDLIKNSFLFNGLKINVTDTAGLTETKNEIEKIGIEKAINASKVADIICYVVDGSVPFTTDDAKALNLVDKNKVILVINKLDLMEDGKKAEILKVYSDNYISVSAKNCMNIEKLKEKIYEKSKVSKIKTNNIILTNQRHYEILNDEISMLKEISDKVSEIPLDLTCDLVQQAYNKLGEITGEVGSSGVIDKIFQNFCLGK